MSDKPTCATCPFFDPLNDTRAKDKGKCRQNAPVASGGVSWWPIVSVSDWCGEHPAFKTEIKVAEAV